MKRRQFLRSLVAAAALGVTTALPIRTFAAPALPIPDDLSALIAEDLRWWVEYYLSPERRKMVWELAESANRTWERDAAHLMNLTFTGPAEG